jgi:hypothetical protein
MIQTFSWCNYWSETTTNACNVCLCHHNMLQSSRNCSNELWPCVMVLTMSSTALVAEVLLVSNMILTWWKASSWLLIFTGFLWPTICQKWLEFIWVCAELKSRSMIHLDQRKSCKCCKKPIIFKFDTNHLSHYTGTPSTSAGSKEEHESEGADCKRRTSWSACSG